MEGRGVSPSLRAAAVSDLELTGKSLYRRSNQFGTDEFMAWCAEVGTEGFLCLNMGTGTLESALDWLEYVNGTSNTYWAEQRRKNGHPEPYGVKYIAL